MPILPRLDDWAIFSTAMLLLASSIPGLGGLQGGGEDLDFEIWTMALSLASVQ